MYPRSVKRAKRKERSEKAVRGVERWRQWKAMLDSGEVETKAELARKVGVSRAAVTVGLRKLEEREG